MSDTTRVLYVVRNKSGYSGSRRGFRYEFDSVDEAFDQCESDNRNHIYAAPYWVVKVTVTEEDVISPLPARGVPAYHPTEHQPARCGGTET